MQIQVYLGVKAIGGGSIIFIIHTTQSTYDKQNWDNWLSISKKITPTPIL